MFEQYTAGAKQVVVLAQRECRALGHDYIGTEHILLGLLHDDKEPAGRVLHALGVTAHDVRARVMEIVDPGQGVASAEIPFTPRAKLVFELARHEADRHPAGDGVCGEHILLALTTLNEGVAARVLLKCGCENSQIREGVLRALPGANAHLEGNAPVNADVRPERATPAGAFAFFAGPDNELQRLLMAAAGRAVGAGRQQFGLADLLAEAGGRPGTGS